MANLTDEVPVLYQDLLTAHAALVNAQGFVDANDLQQRFQTMRFSAEYHSPLARALGEAEKRIKGYIDSVDDQ